MAQHTQFASAAWPPKSSSANDGLAPLAFPQGHGAPICEETKNVVTTSQDTLPGAGACPPRLASERYRLDDKISASGHIFWAFDIADCSRGVIWGQPCVAACTGNWCCAAARLVEKGQFNYMSSKRRVCVGSGVGERGRGSAARSNISSPRMASHKRVAAICTCPAAVSAAHKGVIRKTAGAAQYLICALCTSQFAARGKMHHAAARRCKR